MMWMGIWSPHHAVTTTLVGPDLESQLKLWISAGYQMIPSCSGWGSHPIHGMIPTSTPNIYKVIDKHYMLWMGIWSLHHAVTTTLVGPDLESQVKLWISAGCQMIPSCSGWGSHPAWNDSHINSKHIQGDCQTLYAVDGDMEPPSCCYHHTCGTGFGGQLKS